MKIDSVTLEVLVRIKTNQKLSLAGFDHRTAETVYMG